jgi:hypothetical protein
MLSLIYETHLLFLAYELLAHIRQKSALQMKFQAMYPYINIGMYQLTTPYQIYKMNTQLYAHSMLMNRYSAGLGVRCRPGFQQPSLLSPLGVATFCSCP